MANPATLHFLCGKLAAGKSTLSKTLAREHGAVLISEDVWLAKLFPDEIETFEDYLKYSARLKDVLAGHVHQLLTQGIPVVLDFPGNVPSQRQWFRSLFEAAGADHRLHYIDAPDALCRTQLAKRNRELPEGSRHISDAAFERITAYFRPPAEEEGFTVVRYPSEG